MGHEKFNRDGLDVGSVCRPISGESIQSIALQKAIILEDHLLEVVGTIADGFQIVF